MIQVMDWGVLVKIHEYFGARELFDLQRGLSNALWEYREKIGKERFREEMEFDPEKKA